MILMTCDRRAAVAVTSALSTCLNCSSKVQDPPSSVLPVDWGVGGWEGRAEDWGARGDCRPARNWP